MQFGGNNERFSDCWLSQDEGRSWSQQLETPPWAARWGVGMAALPSGALVLARKFGVHNESLADFWLGRVGDAAGEVELLKGEVSRLRAEQQWLAISRIPRMPAAEGFSWPDGQNGQVSDHQRRGEAPQYPRQLHPVACAAPRAWTCGSRTCSSCSLTAILSLLPSLIFAVLTARTSRPSSTAIGMWRSTTVSSATTSCCGGK